MSGKRLHPRGRPARGLWPSLAVSLFVGSGAVGERIMSLLSGKTSKTGSAQYGTHMEGLGGPGLPKHVLQDFPPFFFFCPSLPHPHSSLLFFFSPKWEGATGLGSPAVGLLLEAAAEDPQGLWEGDFHPEGAVETAEP